MECDEEEHKNSCFLRGVRWWTEQVSTGNNCKEAELGGTKLEEKGKQGKEFKLEVMRKQGQECAAGGGDKSAADVKEVEPKSKERKSEAKQGGQGKTCNRASSIKTLKVKKVVRVTTTNKDACTQVKSDNQKVNQEPSRFLVEGETGNNCMGANYKGKFKHRSEC